MKLPDGMVVASSGIRTTHCGVTANHGRWLCGTCGSMCPDVDDPNPSGCGKRIDYIHYEFEWDTRHGVTDG